MPFLGTASDENVSVSSCAKQRQSPEHLLWIILTLFYVKSDPHVLRITIKNAEIQKRDTTCLQDATQQASFNSASLEHNFQPMFFKTTLVILVFASFSLLSRGLVTPPDPLGFRSEPADSSHRPHAPCLPFEKHDKHGHCVPTSEPLGANCTKDSDCQSQKCWPQFWYYGQNICSPSPAGVPCRHDLTCISGMYPFS